ncbi:hypothetical protein [Maribellus maritimus]|uniref:hypothetical protein n=1 Tax=Maribellus maritimus TaxID=2870838 RepID=UPI001EE9E8DF|nr:hypothetical protein [Maribellus maritimus]MCG6191285.1 hypothetical protein [Maribellus maritimus]
MRGTDMNRISYQYFKGADLMEIEGVNDATIMAGISEIGLTSIREFKRRTLANSVKRNNYKKGRPTAIIVKTYLKQIARG